MKKTAKIILIIIVSAIFLLFIAFVLFEMMWSGAFNKFFAKEIASYESPDGTHILTFYQLGDPEWPFGKTDVRLTLKNSVGKKTASVDTVIHDDGANASEYNVKEVIWLDDRVTVTLCGSEMQDTETVLFYEKQKNK